MTPTFKALAVWAQLCALVLVACIAGDLYLTLKRTLASSARAQWAQVYWLRRAQLSSEEMQEFWELHE